MPSSDIPHQIPESWEELDYFLKKEIDIQKTLLLLKTAERRKTAAISIDNYLFNLMTERWDWCPKSASVFIGGFYKVAEKLNKRIDDLSKEVVDYNIFINNLKYNKDVLYELLSERHSEVFDPDKKISIRLKKHNLENEHVKREYERVDKCRLPPTDPEVMGDIRKGPNVKQTSLFLNNKQSGTFYYDEHRIDVKEKIEAKKMRSCDFFVKYMKSDESMSASNKLSETYSVPIEIVPNILVKVPRRIERFINGEINYLLRVSNGDVTSNYTRGLVVAYLTGRMFGCAYLCAQLYMKAFADFVVESSPLLNKKSKEDDLVLSFSKMKLALKSSRNREKYKLNRKNFKRFDTDNTMTYPAALLGYKHPASYDNSTRDLIVDANNYIPNRTDRQAVNMMRSPISEHAIDGPIAEWLAISMSVALKRRIDPQYALLLLSNWAASKVDSNPELLKRAANGLNVFFHQESGLAIPGVGFGVGMTNKRLRLFTDKILTKVIAPILKYSKRLKTDTITRSHEPATDYDKLVSSIEHADANCVLARENADLVLMSSGLFTNNNVVNDNKVGENGTKKCGCDCHLLNHKLAGLRFVPCEKRRRICEEEYMRMIMSQPLLITSFGVCGYQHPLTSSSDKDLLVANQMVKDRLLYIQREIAAAIGWSRLLQFYLTNGDSNDKNEIESKKSIRDKYNIKDTLYKLNRRMIEFFSEHAKTTHICDNIISHISAKFNAEMLPLGLKPNSFIRTKAGSIIKEHAREVSMMTSQEISNELLENAKKCVTGEHRYREYQINRPFLASESRRVEGRPLSAFEPDKFDPIPLFDIVSPIYEKDENIIDNTATKNMKIQSSYKIKMNNLNFTEACVAYGLVSNSKLCNDPYVLDTLVSGNCVEADCSNHLPLVNGIKNIFDTDKRTEKPRRSDDHSQWSSKNTGQSGRNMTEFKTNSVILVVDYELDKEGKAVERYEDDVFLVVVDSQNNATQNDITYPKTGPKNENDKSSTVMIEAPDFSPLYKHGEKMIALTLKRR